MSASRWIAAAGLSLLGMLAPVGAAQAAGPSVGALGVGGTGCPAGTVRAAVTTDSLSLRFSSFRASAGGARSFDRKSCGISIPLRVPAGMSVTIVGVTYRGTSNLPSGGSARLSAEIFFSGGQGPVATRTINGPTNGAFNFSTAAVGSVWSACGATVNLRVNSSVLVKTARGISASAGIRSQDVNAGLVYQLKFKRC
jgi:hypothetical protein